MGVLTNVVALLQNWYRHISTAQICSVFRGIAVCTCGNPLANFAKGYPLHRYPPAEGAEHMIYSLANVAKEYWKSLGSFALAEGKQVVLLEVSQRVLAIHCKHHID
jgi:hypothetical protein